MTERTPLSRAELSTALSALPDWRARVGALHTAYAADTAAGALALVAAIGSAAEELDHHPDVDWRYRHVFVRTSTHAAGNSVTAMDVELATRVSALAAAQGAAAVPEQSHTIEIAIDTADPAAIRDLWADALGYRAAPGDDSALVDPWGRGPGLWFQQTATPNASRMHVDILLADEQAEPRARKLAETAASVDDAHAPSFWVVTDVQGNRLCVCTNAPDPEDKVEKAGSDEAAGAVPETAPQ